MRLPVLSPREGRLWGWTAAVVAVIFGSIPVAGALAEWVERQGLIDGLFFGAFLLVWVAVVLQALRSRPRGLEIGVVVGVAAAFVLVALRVGAAAERSHLVEYAVVALLAYDALLERRAAGGRVPAPGLLAVALTVALGGLDEAVQSAVPGRTFDPRDIGFDAVAAVLAVGGSGLLRRLRRRRERSPRGPQGR